jgi:acyl carrier protein
VRGFRIELGEIENVLLAQDGVQQTAVVLREENEDKRLVAYFVGDAEIDILRLQLLQRLPEHMLPSAFVRLDSFPLTPNGKLNRQALPAPVYADAQAEFVAPRTPAEQLIAAIWQDVLQVEQVGVHDDFFLLGGHSLLATQVISRIRSQMLVNIPIASSFQYRTLETLAGFVSMLQTNSQAIDMEAEFEEI